MYRVVSSEKFSMKALLCFKLKNAVYKYDEQFQDHEIFY